MSAVVYVAGPMAGLPEQNYPAFNAAADKLRSLGYAVLNPVDSEAENDTGRPQHWIWYMRRAIAQMVEAEGIALLPGWEQSRGAVLEVQIGLALEMDIRPFEAWL